MRLIDADELKHRMETVEMFGLKGLMKVARGMVIVSPTIDAVSVVRCKDCRWWGGGFCVNLKGFGAEEDDYCAWGERREDGKTD